MEKDYDVIIIGGGIIGSFIYRECALRGLRPVLFEREDFGAQTTSASTRLIHGGLRYLARLRDLALVRESLVERQVLRRIAPHLVHDQEFLLPVYADRMELPAPIRTLCSLLPRKLSRFVQARSVRFGVWLYSFLGGIRTAPKVPRIAGASLPITKEDLLDVLVYEDGRVFYPERLCLEAVLQGDAYGGSSYNHAQVRTILFDDKDRANGVRVELAGEEQTVRSPVVINATGPQIDALNRDAGSSRGSARRGSLLLRLGGIHVVVPPFEGSEWLGRKGLVIPGEGENGKKRILFLLPDDGPTGRNWVIGTTEERIADDLDAADYTPAATEVKELLEDVARVVPGFKLTTKDVSSSYAGVRPLRRQSGDATTASRKDLIHIDSHTGIISVTGKLTPARRVAERVVNRVIGVLGKGEHRRTDVVPFPGAKPLAGLAGEAKAVYEMEISLRVVKHLEALYGTRYVQVVRLALQDFKLAKLIHGRTIAAQVVFAVREEKALTLADVMLRRTELHRADGHGGALLDEVCGLMAPELSWSPEEVGRQKIAYLELMDKRYAAH